MGWLETISSVLGTGAGGATIAGAIYAGSIALENEMRADAKKDIATLINNTSIKPDPRITTSFILDAFGVIFGPYHFTKRCFSRSVMSTLCCAIVVLMMFYLKYPDSIKYLWNVSFPKHPTYAIEKVLVPALVIFFYLCCIIIPDYLSLYKGRIILQKMASKSTMRRIFLLVLIDLIASALISATCILLVFTLLIYYADHGRGSDGALHQVVRYMVDGLSILWGKQSTDPGDILFPIFLLSTALTSIWAILVVLSSVVLKVLGSLTGFMTFIRWMFDVDAHPIRVLGLVAAAIVWAGSVFYGAL
jgi:hypothetical protein